MAQAPVTTTSRTRSSPGRRSASEAGASPTRGRTSNTSTRPRRSPRTWTTPRDGCRYVDATWSSVVLPAPFGPRTTQRSPSSTAQSTASRIGLPPRITVTPRRSRTSAVTRANLRQWSPGRMTTCAAYPGGVARVTVSPKRAATFVAWVNAFLSDAADPDTASEAVRGRDLAHVIKGLPGSPDEATLPVAMQVLRRDGATSFQLVLPVPGDLYGLPGPPAFNASALAAGEAVLVGGLPFGLVPSVRDIGEGPATRVAVDWQGVNVEERPNPPPPA